MSERCPTCGQSAPAIALPSAQALAQRIGTVRVTVDGTWDDDIDDSRDGFPTREDPVLGWRDWAGMFLLVAVVCLVCVVVI